MPEGNGFDLLDLFTQIDFEVIFVTAYEEYALKAIKSNAADYLLKPIGILELKEAVSRALKRINSKRALTTTKSLSTPLQDKITVPIKDGFIYVKVNEIIRCEAEGGYTWVYFLGKERVLVTKTLKEFEELFSSKEFSRVHHHHLINLNYVSRYNHGRSGTVIMSDGTSIEVSQRKRSEFLQKIGVKE
jgi:two-component system LytT family response regulator